MLVLFLRCFDLVQNSARNTAIRHRHIYIHIYIYIYLYLYTYIYIYIYMYNTKNKKVPCSARMSFGFPPIEPICASLKKGTATSRKIRANCQKARLQACGGPAACADSSENCSHESWVELHPLWSSAWIHETCSNWAVPKSLRQGIQQIPGCLL